MANQKEKIRYKKRKVSREALELAQHFGADPKAIEEALKVRETTLSISSPHQKS